MEELEELGLLILLLGVPIMMLIPVFRQLFFVARAARAARELDRAIDDENEN